MVSITVMGHTETQSRKSDLNNSQEVSRYLYQGIWMSWWKKPRNTKEFPTFSQLHINEKKEKKFYLIRLEALSKVGV